MILIPETYFLKRSAKRVLERVLRRCEHGTVYGRKAIIITGLPGNKKGLLENLIKITTGYRRGSQWQFINTIFIQGIINFIINFGSSAKTQLLLAIGTTEIELSAIPNTESLNYCFFLAIHVESDTTSILGN